MDAAHLPSLIIIVGFKICSSLISFTINKQKPQIMEKFTVISFIVRYLICLGLLYYTYKANKQNTLFKSIYTSFFGLSLIILANFLLSLTSLFEGGTPFYEVNFTDFLIVTLFVNIFFSREKKGSNTIGTKDL